MSGVRGPEESGHGQGPTPRRRWAEIDALFSRALDLPQTEREAFLMESTDDEDVRGEAGYQMSSAHD
ncbi:MAG: hypothetical protein LC667_20215 [Thioalkalivibrio sp.]|nr:hypothetical protein [Thioalkalivibrio sp.]